MNRAIGVDFVSSSSISHRDDGRAAHRAFLAPNDPGEPILLIEDMDLSADLSQLMRVVVAPLRVEGMDSACCTIIGELESLTK
jgi:kynurenine formamidase